MAGGKIPAGHPFIKTKVTREIIPTHPHDCRKKSLSLQKLGKPFVMEKYDIFISHSSIDKELAFRICNYLECNGIQCWIAPRDITPGAAYPNEITRGIRASRIFLVILSTQSVNSAHVNTETDIAFNDKKIILPFFVEEATLEDSMAYYLARKQWILGYPDFQKSLPWLLTSIRSELSDKNMEAKKVTDPEARTTEPYPITPTGQPASLNPFKNNLTPILTLGVLGLILLWFVMYTIDNCSVANERPVLTNEAVVEPKTDEVAVEADARTGHQVAPIEIYNDIRNKYVSGVTPEVSATTLIDNRNYTSSWTINNNGYSPNFKADIFMPYEDYSNIHLSLFANKKALEGVVEDPDGTNIGYFEGKMNTNIPERIIIRGNMKLEKYNYASKKLETELTIDEQTLQAIKTTISRH